MHVEAQYYIVSEFVEEGYIKTIFVRSIENNIDGFRADKTTEVYNANARTYLQSTSSGDCIDLFMGG